MMFAAAVWCSLTCVAPTALVAGQPGSCVADSVAPACLDGFRVRGQAQWGMRDTLVYEERGLTIPGGATVRSDLYLTDGVSYVFGKATTLSKPAAVLAQLQTWAVADANTGAVPNATWGYGKLRMLYNPTSCQNQNCIRPAGLLGFSVRPRRSRWRCFVHCPARCPPIMPGWGAPPTRPGPRSPCSRSTELPRSCPRR